MGIAKGAYKFLLELRVTTNAVHGKVLQLGRQWIYLTPNQVIDNAKQYGIEISTSFKNNSFFDKNPSKNNYVNDIDFFKAVGFDTVESLDVSDFEKCDVIHDLNDPIPEKYHGQYDAIYDGGTLEHVFHFPNCLANIHKLLKPNGVIMHCSPSHNHVDHGFYMFCPTVYHDYYTANNYKILKSNIFEYHEASDKKPWTVYDYQPGSIDNLSYGGWGKKLLAIWFVAQKVEGSTCGVIPQQNVYERLYGNKSLSNNEQVQINPETSVDKIRRSLNRKGLLFFFAKLLYRAYRLLVAIIKKIKFIHFFVRKLRILLFNINNNRKRRKAKKRRPKVVAYY